MEQIEESKQKLFEQQQDEQIKSYTRTLLLFNDDHNTFDYVVESLIKVCGHSEMQAEQCALIAHHKGKCDVKRGGFPKLKFMKDQLIDRGLHVIIK